MLPTKLNLQGSAQAWRKAAVSGDVWNDDDEKQDENAIELRDIYCTECETHHRADEMKVKVKTGYSNLTCKNKDCRKVTSSATWRCRCRRLWMKCPLRVHANLRERGGVQKKKKQQSVRARPRATRGVDAPMPKIRRTSTAYGCNPTDQMQPPVIQSAIRLRPGARLAEKFPHHVQATGST